MTQGVQSRCKVQSLYESGCYFFAILRQVEVEHDIEFNDYDVLKLYKKAIDRRYMREDCFIDDAVGLANLAAQPCLAMGVPDYSRIRTSDVQPSKDVYIICFKKPMYTHFMLYDHGEMWDSLDPNRPGARGYSIDSYRILT